MASIWGSSPAILPHRSHLPLRSATLILSFPSLGTPPICLALRATGTEGGARVGSSQGSPEPSLLRRPPLVPPPPPESTETPPVSGENPIEEDDEEEDRSQGANRGKNRRRRQDDLLDWEDQILEDTVPLVSFVRMLLHSGKYGSGDRLSPEHEKTITERLLPYHPESEKKIGCGIDFITIGYHPQFESSRCLFIVRKDGELVDFSYWKCIKGLIRKNYPLHADSFILRHFRRSRYTEIK